ncbi:MAG: sel1 repeat family protein [Deltaproteobacteria bacterium]|nr:sel1 repeat family protein [Deltaproteobacteria bacterium]
MLDDPGLERAAAGVDAGERLNSGSDDRAEEGGLDWDDARVVGLWRKEAEQGDAEAQFNLGIAYSCGFGIVQNEEKAVYWYARAAAQGHDDARFFVWRLGAKNMG